MYWLSLQAKPLQLVKMAEMWKENKQKWNKNNKTPFCKAWL